MKRKRKERERALNLPGVRLEVVGAVRTAARKCGFGFDDDSVIELALEGATTLNLDLSDCEIESVARRLPGRPRIDDLEYIYHPWHT